MPKYLEITGPSGPVGQVPLEGDQVNIGRDENSQVVLADEHVRKRHCVLRRLGDTWLLEDVSQGGLKVNGRMTASAELKTGDLIEIGDFRLRLLGGQPEDRPGPGDDGDMDKTVLLDLGGVDHDKSFLRQPAMLVVGPDGGHDGGRMVNVDRERFVIGKASLCDLVLDSPYVSRNHAEIEFIDGEYRVRDLGSTNGTFLDDGRVIEAGLPYGSTVTIGPFSMSFVARTEDRPAEPGLEPETGLEGMVGVSPSMQRVYDLIRRAAKSDATVIIEGPTGSGKELAARAIHLLSRRRAGPFSTVDCGSIPETLIESELFGHEKGAFTGAVARRAGAFEQGHDGTVFLDEIGELPLTMQPKLLRFLEERTLKRVGGTEVLGINTRVIAATHRQLREMVQRNDFREDLYFRLFIIPITLPPVKDRQGDIPLLAQHFVRQARSETGHDVGAVTLSPEAMDRLKNYPWPGNVRELKNVILRAMVLADGPLLGPDHIQFLAAGEPVIQTPGITPEAAPAMDTAPGSMALADMEKQHISRVLNECGGNKKATAKKLGIALSTLYDKLKRYGLDNKSG